jgi:hypothetical protein
MRPPSPPRQRKPQEDEKMRRYYGFKPSRIYGENQDLPGKYGSSHVVLQAIATAY